MKKSKKIGLGILSAVAMISTCVAIGVGGTFASADDSMKSDGDSFLLSDTTYAEDERFVYTATVSFAEGNAAGLVFGATEGEEYWVFNIDRNENKVKLIYFAEEGGSLHASELLSDWFIGNDKMTDSERALVNPKVASVESVQLKVILSPETDGAYAEFYADNIKRFGVDSKIELNSLQQLPDGVSYKGGAIGYNCFHASVSFSKVYTGISDYSYYTELYRQQYHFSQYAHWNNDPNGLVYYDGYYHQFYQTHPYSNYWSDMYWGHARSKDLVHWELLPICLFPDGEADWGNGNGYMWSGSAMVYHKGDSQAIDNANWYPNGNGTGLLAFYTRDGAKQDTMIMSSDDGGMTWTKRKRIDQEVATGHDGYYNKTDCRDPKVFSVKKSGGKTTVWGMALTGQGTNSIWFLKSTDLLNWSYAGGFKAYVPECPEVQTIQADDSSTHTVFAFTGRNYLVGDISYDEGTGLISFRDLNGEDYADKAIEDIAFQKMEYAKDSYATQCFYIDDPSSEYYGKSVSISWYSGEPNDRVTTIESGQLAALRKTWNGGGFTIPVEWGLKKTDSGYVLTQTPVVKTSSAFNEIKSSLVSVTDKAVGETDGNLLESVQTHTFELQATIDNPDEREISFRINMGTDEYTEFGWNQTDGYYVDRTNTSDGGLNMVAYHMRYNSGIKGGSSTKTFYVLSDNGGIEVFCEDFSVPFYVLTFASPYSVKSELTVSGDVTVKSLTVNQLDTVWREGVSENETVLYLSDESVELDRTITLEKSIMAYSTAGGEIAWTVESGEDVVSVEKTESGAVLKSKAVGTATIKVTCGNAVKEITVTVVDGAPDIDFAYTPEGVISGTWLVSAEGLVGIQSTGDGFLLSNEQAKDFVYTANFDLGQGAAAALVFRAERDFSSYLIANYDKNGQIVKLWSKDREIARASVGGIDLSNVTLSVTAKGKDITVSLNGNKVIETTLLEGDPQSGYFGLNVCATRATFKSVTLRTDEYIYDGGDLVIGGGVSQTVYGVYNVTLNNVKLDNGFYVVSGRKIKILESYFATLPSAGVYKFTLKGGIEKFEFTVTVNEIPKIALNDVTVQKGCNVVFYIGERTAEGLELNGKALPTNGYSVQNGVLTVYADSFNVGENTLKLSDGTTVTITVEERKSYEQPQEERGFFDFIIDFFMSVFRWFMGLFGVEV